MNGHDWREVQLLLEGLGFLVVDMSKREGTILIKIPEVR